MPFIGAQPATTFAKATSQVFTNANGSIVDFTLNKHVSNPEDIEVFVSNVQQQPTTSYTILSDGVTLRFSEAPPSGDFYVVYRNLAQQTGTDTGAFRKTGGSISDAVYVTGNDSSYTQASGNATSTLSVINSSYTNSGNGVLYVKQGAGTNQPTMTIEQTGGGGNPDDTQGLHIKIAGQNQGSGKAIRVTTTNSSLNSGNAFDAFTVYNGGDVSVYGNIAMGANKGIDFASASAGTGGTGAAETSTATVLDDYEEGTFTPSSNSVFGGSPTAVGMYVKVGNMVNVSVRFSASGASTNGHQFGIYLPFKAGSTQSSGSFNTWFGNGMFTSGNSNGQHRVWGLEGNGNYVDIRQQNASNTSQITGSAQGGSFGMHFSITYRTKD
mgnify:CR=1 FL=1|tara:strand:+ start:2136 stop:3281 length:1146 start_codon:yes stop_codon:yes gene_type:complete